MSVACPNEAGLVLRTLTRQGPTAAQAELDVTTQYSHTLAHESQRLAREDVAAAADPDLIDNDDA